MWDNSLPWVFELTCLDLAVTLPLSKAGRRTEVDDRTPIQLPSLPSLSLAHSQPDGPFLNFMLLVAGLSNTSLPSVSFIIGHSGTIIGTSAAILDTLPPPVPGAIVVDIGAVSVIGKTYFISLINSFKVILTKMERVKLG